MRPLIEKFYGLVFQDKNDGEEVPYSNKRFMFWFSIISFSIVLLFIIKDIIQNIQAIKS